MKSADQRLRFGLVLAVTALGIAVLWVAASIESPWCDAYLMDNLDCTPDYLALTGTIVLASAVVAAAGFAARRSLSQKWAVFSIPFAMLITIAGVAFIHADFVWFSLYGGEW